MKSTFAFALLAVAAIGIASCNSESTYNDMTELPESAQAVVNENFTSNVISTKVETNTIGVDEYEVYLADGSKIKFEGNEWEEVTVTPGNSVPEYFVLEPIRVYVTETMPGQDIVKIEREKTGYEVKLANNMELVFDNNGTFIKVD